jgi:CubicO group peptidase (beta-lactamase class C family)
VKYSLFIFLFFSHISSAKIQPVTKERELELDKKFEVILEKHKINTIGVSLIKAGEINWIGHYGEQSSGIPASKSTLFNVGSLTKTITTQTVLQLVQAQKIMLDESMSHYWVDPDLSQDSRHSALTPRMVLSHTTGFLNWRFFSRDRKLKFVNEPGTTYGYSGEGFEYLAKFVEKKLSVPFEQLAQKYVFKPAGIKNVSLSVNKDNFKRIAKAKDKNGEFPGYYCSPQGWCSKEGQVSVAGNMVITVEDYSKFLIWAMQESGLADDLKRQINSISIDQPLFKGFDCKKRPSAICPMAQGFGLGWNLTQFKDGKLIGHGGSDWSLVTLTYYYPESRDGLVIFLNGPQAFASKAIIDAILLLDPNSAKIHEYQFRLDRNSN